MSEADIKKPEAVKPAAPSESHDSKDSNAHALSVFAQSLVYSAIEAPARGVAQLADHLLTTHLDQKIEKKFANMGVGKQEETDFNTNAWKAQQLGQSIGMIVPMAVSRELMIGKAVIGKVESSLTKQALRDAGVSARTGLFNGVVLTPSDTDDAQNHFWHARFKQGINDFVTFGAMGFSSTLTGGALKGVANGLEKTALPAALKTPFTSAINHSFTHGLISGVPGGAIQAQLGAMENGKLYASGDDFKKSIASMMLTGGTIGSAGFLKETMAKGAPKVERTAAMEAPDPAEVAKSQQQKTSHLLDIKFDPIVEAWKPEDVNKHMTVETRTIDFVPKDRDKSLAGKDWNKFEDWGVEKRDVSANVYRFPGLKAEIVVPSEYAAILDQVRLRRLNAGGENTMTVAMRSDRILPEEAAQYLLRMPQSDLAKSVQLLDHENPSDIQRTYNRDQALIANGEKPETKPFMSLADANTAAGAIRYFDVNMNIEAEVHSTTSHEFSHLAEKDRVFKAFDAAAHAERDGYFKSKYSRESTRENWAVHLGEQFMHPDGAHFAELPEKAPARTLVMAKAVRNMLKQREGDPSPRHQEFMARVEAAETTATARLQDGIKSDLAEGNYDALADKLKFLSAAAREGQSPEILERVINPIQRDLIPIMHTQGAPARAARHALTELMTVKQTYVSQNNRYTPFKSP